MAGTGPEDLHELAVTLLDACIEALDTIPDYAATLLGAPDRAFVAPGPVVLDCCDQLTVHVGPISERAAMSARINQVALVITAARCVPVPDKSGHPPSTAAQQEAAEQIHADKWALWNHLYNLINADLLFERCCGVVWGSLASLLPSGGCGGSTLTLTVCFDGYEETFGT